MFKRNLLLSVIICLLVINVFAANVFCTELNTGDPMESYMDVVAYSNGENSGTKYGNLNYQCVAYIKRFYRQYYNLGLDQISVGVARNYYLAFESLNFARFGLERYDNNGYVPPKPTDILVFNNSNNVGHVAIITNVTAATVSIIEQNWNRNKCKRDLPLTIVNGKYFIGTVLDYPVLGWLGLPRDSNSIPSLIPSPTYRWDFNITGYCEGWTMTNVEKYSVQDSIFYINPIESDPYINSPDVSIDSENNSFLIIRMASNACDTKGAVYFTTDTLPNWDENKKEKFYVCNDGKYYKYCIPMKVNSNWQDTITHFRIDPADTGLPGSDPNDTIGIDYIYFDSVDWEFNTLFDTEGWTQNNIELLLSWNGVLYINSKNSDPYITSPILSKNAEDFNYIFIRMLSKAPDGVGALYFTTSSSPNWSEDKKSDFHIYNDGYYHNYFINMENKWSWRDTITQIRIDPADEGIENSTDDRIFIECIHIY